MTLSIEQMRILEKAISSYAYPKVTFDFCNQTEVVYSSMRQVESVIQDSLRSANLQKVKDGLSGVLYWGHYRAGYRATRVERFRNHVTDEELKGAKNLFNRLSGPGLREIANLDLPEFSKMSFVSKVRMFLDPVNYVTLDLKLVRWGKEHVKSLFSWITLHPTYLPISESNERYYEQWCDLCRRIVCNYFPKGTLRAVDVERGIFQLIEQDQRASAADILNQALEDAQPGDVRQTAKGTTCRLEES